MKKRIISLLMAIVMVLGTFPAAVWAEDVGEGSAADAGISVPAGPESGADMGDTAPVGENAAAPEDKAPAPEDGDAVPEDGNIVPGNGDTAAPESGDAAPENGVVPLADAPSVVSVTIDGETTEYSDIVDAFEETVNYKNVNAAFTLLANVELPEKNNFPGRIGFRSSGTSTLDLNGYTITHADTGYTDWNTASIIDVGGGTLTITGGGTIRGMYNTAAISVIGGTLILDDGIAVEGEFAYGEKEFNGITVADKARAITVNRGTLIVKGGAFTATSGVALEYMRGTVLLYGGSFSGVSIATKDYSEVINEGVTIVDLLAPGYTYQHTDGSALEDYYVQNISAVKVVKGLTPVPYADENGADATAAEYIQMEPDTTQWNGGVYVVRGNVTIDGGVTVSGKMPSIILCDRASLTVNGGITLPGDRPEALTIYGQTGGTGEMTVKNSGGAAFSSGNLAVIRLLGGTLTATGKGTAFSKVDTWNQQDGNDEIKCIETGSEPEVRVDGRSVSSVTLSRCTAHSWGYAQHTGAEQHMRTCELCGYNPHGVGGYEDCVYDTYYGGDESGHRKACVCNRTERGAALTKHTPDYIPNADGETHTYRCTVCRFVSDATAEQHTYVDGVCSACKYQCPHEDIDAVINSATEGVCKVCGKRIYVARLVVNEGERYETVEYAETVREALERYKNGSPVVTLLCDVDMGTDALVVTAEVTGKLLDLNGHRLSGSGDTVFQIYKKYGFTVKNGTIENTGDGDAIQLIRVYSGNYFDGNLTLEDVNVTAAKGWAVKAAYDPNDTEGAVNPGNGELYIKSGTYKGGLNGGALRIIQISGGTFIANEGTHSIMNPGPVTGAAALQKYLAPEHTYADADGNAINYFSSENHTLGDETNTLGYRLDIWLNADKVTITGHTTHDIDRETGKCSICGAPCPHVALDDAGFCTACGGRVMFCEVEGTLYPTIYKALEAVTNRTDNPVIKLLADYTAYVINIGTANGCTLDLNGFRITTSQVIIYKDHVLTIMDSSAEKSGSMGALWVDGGHVTIRDGSYDEIIASYADSIKITGEGTVKIRKIQMTGENGGSNKKVVADLLNPGYAVYLVDENTTPATYTLVDGYHNRNNTSSGYLQQYLPGDYKDSPAVLPAGQYYTVAAHTHDFADSTQTTCACGLTCDHATVNADGKCATCGKVFAVEVKDDKDNISYYADGINAGGNTRSGLDAAFAAAPNGSTVTVLGGDSITAYLDGGKSLTLALNGKDVGNIYVGRSEGANSLTVTGTGNIQNIYVHQGNEADLTGWTGKMEQLYVYSGGKATLNGGTFGKVVLNGKTAGSLLVSGYAFRYEDGSYVAYDAADDLTKTVSVVPCDYEGWYSSDSSAVCPYCAQPGAVRVPVTLDGTAQYAFYLTLQNVIDDQNRSDNNKNPATLLQNISGDCTIDENVFIDTQRRSIDGTLTVKDAVVSFSGSGSRITAVTMFGGEARFGLFQRSSAIPEIGTLTIADGADWGSILPTEFDRHGYKLPKDDGGYEWRDGDTADAAVSSMTNVSIARLPIPSMTLLLWANGKTTRSEPIGTTVRLEATCTMGASVTFYIQKEGSDTPVTLAGEDLDFGKYSAEYQFSEVGKYTVWFVGTKDGYSARSVDEPLTITKLEIPADAITPPTAKTGMVYDGTAQELIEPGQLDPKYGIFVFGDIGDQFYEFSTKIPKATSAGTYQYYYLIRGSEDYAGTTFPESIDITIAKRELSVTDVAVMEKVYDGTNEVTFGEVTFSNALASETPGHVVSGVYSDCNAGDNKTIDIKVELRGGSDKNYMFAGGTANTMFQKTGLSIRKAPAPTVTETARVLVSNGVEKTYTVQLPTIPDAPAGEYGAVTYEVSAVDLDEGYYIGGAFVSGDGRTMTLPIAKNAVDTEGAIGTVTILAKSDNYQDIAITVNVSAENKIRPTGAPELSSTELEYGNMLQSIRLSGNMFDNGRVVPGTFRWVQPNAQPGTETYTARWVFTPADTQRYTVVYGEVQLTVVGRPEEDIHDVAGNVVYVDKNGNRIGSVIGANVELVIGKRHISEATTDGNGAFDLKGVASGTYNVIVTVNTPQQKTVTAKLVIEKTDGNVTMQPITLRTEDINSTLDVEDSLFDMIVGGLDKLAEKLFDTEFPDGGNGASMKADMDVVQQAPDPQDKEQTRIRDLVSDQELDFMTIRVVKHVGERTETLDDIGNLGLVLEMLVNYDTSRKDIKVYRYHEGRKGVEVTSFEENDTKADGTFYIDYEKKCIHIFTNKFSTYAIGYTPESGNRYYYNGGTAGAKSGESPATGDVGLLPYAAMALTGCTGVVVLTFRRKREHE